MSPSKRSSARAACSRALAMASSAARALRSASASAFSPSARRSAAARRAGFRRLDLADQRRALLGKNARSVFEARALRLRLLRARGEGLDLRSAAVVAFAPALRDRRRGRQAAAPQFRLRARAPALARAPRQARALVLYCGAQATSCASISCAGGSRCERRAPLRFARRLFRRGLRSTAPLPRPARRAERHCGSLAVPPRHIHRGRDPPRAGARASCCAPQPRLHCCAQLALAPRSPPAAWLAASDAPARARPRCRRGGSCRRGGGRLRRCIGGD